MQAATAASHRAPSAPESRVPRLLTVQQFADDHREFTVAQVRNYVFYSQARVTPRGEQIPANGLAPAVVRIGRRVYIDEDQFFAWVKAQAKAA